MKLNITSSQLAEGIIVIDSNPQLSGQMRTKVNRLEFEIIDDVIRIKDIGNTQLTPTVKTGVTGFVFDESSKSLEIMNDRNLVYKVPTTQKTILIRVDFTTATITIFE
jgi:RNase P/RNase MRP subunit p29